MKSTLTKFQTCNRNALMLLKGNIKSLSSSENTIGSITRSIKTLLTQFRMCNRNDLMLPNGSIK